MGELVQRDVLIDVAREFARRIGRKAPSVLEFRVACAAGASPYLKKLQIKAFLRATQKNSRKYHLTGSPIILTIHYCMNLRKLTI